jgi:hypothetical protein
MRYMGRTVVRKALRTILILLAVLFLFAEAAKFFMPVDQVTKGYAGGSFTTLLTSAKCRADLVSSFPGSLRIKPASRPWLPRDW